VADSETNVEPFTPEVLARRLIEQYGHEAAIQAALNADYLYSRNDEALANIWHEAAKIINVVQHTKCAHQIEAKMRNIGRTLNVKRLSLAFLMLFLSAAVSHAAGPPPKGTKGVDGIFAAFQSHPLVGISEFHNLAQEADFYVSVINDPRFAEQVGNVVLEVGDAAQQDVADRYESGEDIPYLQLRKVWTDVVGWVPTVTALGSINIFPEVRSVNQTLPPEKRIKVWLGEPPIDWSQIKTKADWQPLNDNRDGFVASVIQREILSKGKKALIIYGAGHLGRNPEQRNLRAILDASNPGTLYVVSPYLGYSSKKCAAPAEAIISRGKAPAIFSPVIGSSLEPVLRRSDCLTFPLPRNLTEEIRQGYNTANNSNLTSDAILYLGPRNILSAGTQVPDIYLDTEFRKEMERRTKIIMGELPTLTLPINNPVSRVPYFKN
jgi:hypothetical protein